MVHNEGIEERATIKRDSGGVLQLGNSYYIGMYLGITCSAGIGRILTIFNLFTRVNSARVLFFQSKDFYAIVGQ